MGQPQTIGNAGGQLSVTNSDGTPYVPVGTLSFASDNTSVASVSASGAVAAVAAGSCNLSALDSGNSDTDSLVCTVSLSESGFVLVLTPNASAAARKA